MLKKNPGPPLTSRTKGSKDAIPAEFLAKIGTKETKQQNPVDVEPDTLTGKLIESKVVQTRTDEREKINTELSGDSVPLISTEMLPTGQVGTRTRTLVPEGTVVVPSATTQRAEQHNLGNSMLDQVVVEAPEVFKEGAYETTIPDVVPEEFRVAVPTTTTEETSEGDADTTPNLATGNLSRRENQIGEFLKRVRVVTRSALTLPKTLTDTYRGGIQGLGSLFSTIVSKARTLSNGQQTPDIGFLVIDSKVHDLGSGQSLKETDTVPSHPNLTDDILDTQYGIIKHRLKSVVQTGTPCPAGSSQFAQNSDQTIRVRETVDSASLASVSWKFAGTTNIDVPPELLSVTAYAIKSAGAGSYSSSGLYTLGSHGSGGVNLRGNASASSASMLEIAYDIKQVWGNHVQCTHVLFFSSAFDRAALRTRIGTIYGASVSDWPKFVPKDVVVVVLGGKGTINMELSAAANDSTVTDFSGAIKLSGSQRSTGVGFQNDVGTSTKAVRIPGTIHAGMNVNVSGDANASAVGSGLITTGANSAGGTVSSSSTSFVASGGIGATPGQSTIPTSGNFISQLNVEPYIPGVVMVHAIVVDFGTLS